MLEGPNADRLERRLFVPTISIIFFLFHANVAEEVFIDKIDNINNNKILDDKSWYELKIACAHPPRLSTSKCQDLEGSRAMKL